MRKLSSAFEKAYTIAAYPYGTMNFIPVSEIHFRIANSRSRWRCNIKGLSQDGGRTDFSENLRSSLFNDDLSKESMLSDRSISLDRIFKRLGSTCM
jgi:hypothetical protein